MRLVLFDIDGTILSTHGAAKRAFHRALLETYGTAGPIAALPFDGKTDRQIARELLGAAGLDDGTINRSFDALWRVYLKALAGELAQPQTRTIVHAGVAELLERLSALQQEYLVGLLTGNIERGASMKLSAVGLEHHFRLGAYGSDSEHRVELPAVAVRRAREISGREFRGHDIGIIGTRPATGRAAPSWARAPSAWPRGGMRPMSWPRRGPGPCSRICPTPSGYCACWKTERLARLAPPGHLCGCPSPRRRAPGVPRRATCPPRANVPRRRSRRIAPSTGS